MIRSKVPNTHYARFGTGGGNIIVLVLLMMKIYNLDRGLNRTDATLEYQKLLDGKLENTFPSIDDIATRDSFLRGELWHVSFDPKKSNNLLPVIQRACLNGADKDAPTHSSHGDGGHSTYKEVLRKIAITDSLMVHESRRKNQVNRENRNVNNLVVETRKYERNTMAPSPFVLADELKKDNCTGRRLKKELRRISLESGVGTAILTGYYAGYGKNEIINLFSDRVFAKTLDNNYLKYPKKGNHAQMRALGIADTRLVRPVETGTQKLPFVKEDYYYALEALKTVGLTTEDESAVLSQFATHKQMAIARVVFTSMEQIAYESAPPGLREPARTDYIIKKFGKEYSTRIKTAYLLVD